MEMENGQGKKATPPTLGVIDTRYYLFRCSSRLYVFIFSFLLYVLTLRPPPPALSRIHQTPYAHGRHLRDFPIAFSRNINFAGKRSNGSENKREIIMTVTPPRPFFGS